ncbi:MAG TPA: hypothetical protein VIM88_09905 [Sulfurovum sp.]|uniref:hypothetical protein n=1 Tax=Sulfurovum sp. TaxID=1969726 RepID=UPI002F91C2D0
MKQTLLHLLSSFSIVILLTACSGQVADKMAVVGEPSLSSDPCAVIDEKVMRLDSFTEVVQNSSAFHLEEKATALPVPGITVSNNRKQMLKDAEKKRAEYAAERQKYGCEPSTADMKDTAISSDPCSAIDRQLIRLDEFTAMVNHTSAFHLEEKATALPVPGITVSNNKKHMLRDVERKRAELLQERENQGCKTPVPAGAATVPDEKPAVKKPAVVSEASAESDQTMMKPDASAAKADPAATLPVEAKAAAEPVAAVTVHHTKAPTRASTTSEVKAEEAAPEAERQTQADKTPMPESTVKTADTKAPASKPAASSGACDAIEEELVQLYEFMLMVKNTSAFHLEEKAQAMPVPGITVSNNKKKMLRDAERRRAELLAERQQQGCETSTK